MVIPKIVTFECECPMCGAINERRIGWNDFLDWYAEGHLIQDVFPYETEQERELLITGLCYSCQDFLFEEDTDFND